MPARLDGNNTCTVQTYTNSVGARVGILKPEEHEEQVPTDEMRFHNRFIYVGVDISIHALLTGGRS